MHTHKKERQSKSRGVSVRRGEIRVYGGNKGAREFSWVSKEHGANGSKISEAGVNRQANQWCIKHEPSVRRCGATARRDGVRSLCAASRAKKGAHVRSCGQVRELLAV